MKLHDNQSNEKYFTPVNLFDYMYALLYSTKYREYYKESLKIDFPIIPYPNNKRIFQKLFQSGAKLRSLHMLEDPNVKQHPLVYPVSGTNIILAPKFSDRLKRYSKIACFDMNRNHICSCLGEVLYIFVWVRNH